MSIHCCWVQPSCRVHFMCTSLLCMTQRMTLNRGTQFRKRLMLFQSLGNVGSPLASPVHSIV